MEIFYLIIDMNSIKIERTICFNEPKANWVKLTYDPIRENYKTEALLTSVFFFQLQCMKINVESLIASILIIISKQVQQIM